MAFRDGDRTKELDNIQEVKLPRGFILQAEREMSRGIREQWEKDIFPHLRQYLILGRRKSHELSKKYGDFFTSISRLKGKEIAVPLGISDSEIYKDQNPQLVQARVVLNQIGKLLIDDTMRVSSSETNAIWMPVQSTSQDSYLPEQLFGKLFLEGKVKKAEFHKIENFDLTTQNGFASSMAAMGGSIAEGTLNDQQFRLLFSKMMFSDFYKFREDQMPSPFISQHWETFAKTLFKMGSGGRKLDVGEGELLAAIQHNCRLGVDELLRVYQEKTNLDTNSVKYVELQRLLIRLSEYLASHLFTIVVAQNQRKNPLLFRDHRRVAKVRFLDPLLNNQDLQLAAHLPLAGRGRLSNLKEGGHISTARLITDPTTLVVSISEKAGLLGEELVYGYLTASLGEIREKMGIKAKILRAFGIKNLDSKRIYLLSDAELAAHRGDSNVYAIIQAVAQEIFKETGIPCVCASPYQEVFKNAGLQAVPQSTQVTRFSFTSGNMEKKEQITDNIAIQVNVPVAIEDSSTRNNWWWLVQQKEPSLVKIPRVGNSDTLLLDEKELLESEEKAWFDVLGRELAIPPLSLFIPLEVIRSMEEMGFEIVYIPGFDILNFTHLKRSGAENFIGMLQKIFPKWRRYETLTPQQKTDFSTTKNLGIWFWEAIEFNAITYPKLPGAWVAIEKEPIRFSREQQSVTPTLKALEFDSYYNHSVQDVEQAIEQNFVPWFLEQTGLEAHDVDVRMLTAVEWNLLANRFGWGKTRELTSTEYGRMYQGQRDRVTVGLSSDEGSSAIVGTIGFSESDEQAKFRVAIILGIRPPYINNSI